MKKAFTYTLVLLSIVSGVIVLKAIIDLSIGVLGYMLTNPFNSMVYTIGLLALFFTYHKIRDAYRR